MEPSELVEVNILGSKNPTLQIMIERKDRNNITLRDCEKVSRSLSTLIDVGDVISDQYTLEISIWIASMSLLTY